VSLFLSLYAAYDDRPQQQPPPLNNNSTPSGKKSHHGGPTGSSRHQGNSGGGAAGSGTSSRSKSDGGHHSAGGSGSAKTTRIRTVLNEKQLHTLRTCYAANPRPDALMKDQLVEMTGLSSRVIRVWFQNKRCKDKKRTILIKQLQQQHQDKVRLPFVPVPVNLLSEMFDIIACTIAWLRNLTSPV